MAAARQNIASRRCRQHRGTSSVSGLAIVVVLFVSMLAVVVAEPSGTAEAAPRQIDISQPGPLGAVSVIGDSVLLGSALVDPTLAQRLSERGWGPIKMRAGEGYSTGFLQTRQSFDATHWLALWRSEGWDAPNVIVNLGANDSGFCVTNSACARQSILHVVDAIGPGRTIWWPQITRFFTHFDQQETWNAALRQIAAERPDFHTWDWPAELPLYQSPDGIHLTGEGYRVRSARMAELFTLAAARGIEHGGDAPLPAAITEPSSFVPLPAQRVIDTRTDPPGRQDSGETLRVDLADVVPTGSTAVSLYVAAAGAGDNGYLSAGPCGEPNSGATVNFAPGPASGAPTLTALGDDGDVCVFTSADTDVIVDLQGAFVPGDSGLELDPLATPTRLYDTRSDGRGTELEIVVPFDAKAVAVNLAAANAEGVGFLRAAPCGETNPGANLNYRPGPPQSSSSIVELSDDATFCVTSSTPADVIVDLTGVFADDGSLSFVAAPPTRTLDTRDGTGGWSPIHGADQVLRFRAAPPEADAVTGTLSVVRPLATTFVAGYGCTGEPPNASANAGVGTIAANSLTSAVTDTGDLCLLAAEPTTTVFDTTGWWL